MKLFKYAPICLTALTLAACSNDDSINGTNGNATEGTTSYVAVRINNVGSSPSGIRHRMRADETPSPYDPTGKGNEYYEDGTTAESKVNSVRFYFFNADGSPYILQNAPSDAATIVKNHLDQNITTSGDNHSETVESLSDAVLVINGKTATQPASMVAIINPTGLVFDATSNPDGVLKDEMNLSQLTGANCISGTFHDATNGFVMSNSVYVDGGVVQNATSCVGFVQTKEDLAKENPVDIYVERVDAKVTATAATVASTPKLGEFYTENGVTKAQVGTISYYETDPATQASVAKKAIIYATIEGWGLADENGKSQVIKQVDASWNSNTLGINPWTSADYHRSFWQTSVPIDDKNPVVNHAYKDYTSTLGSSLYTLGNTPSSTAEFTADNNLTKVVVAAKLTYKVEGENTEQVAEICSYRGNQYITKIAALNAIASNYAKYFTKSGNTYTSLKGDDIEFTTNVPTTVTAKDYQVVCKLTDAVTVYKLENGNYVDATDELNGKLNQEIAECRTGGATYYYAMIRHLGAQTTDLGAYGIVRNHSYKITFNSVKGFGTPVFDVEKTIDPVVPTDADTYLAAKIHVLSWRVVNSTVELGQ